MRCRLLLALGLAVPLTISAQEAPGLPGTYSAGPITITFEPGKYRIARGGQVAISGEYHLTADTVTFRDLSGAIACNPSVAGRYLWRRTDTTLVFTLIDDACPGRKGAMPRPWQRQSDVLALTGATLIDGSGAAPRAGTTILISGSRISDVFPDGTKPIPADARTRDLSGRFVIPGLIDAHVHLATDPSGDDARAKWEPKLRQTLLGGVTSVRDMAGDARSLADLSRATKVGDITGPDIYYSALFAGPDFFSDPRVQASSRGETVGQVPWARAVTSTTDWRLAIAEARGTGASGIKLYAAMNTELLAPLVTEAHAQGLRVWAHASLIPARPSDEVNAGVDVLSHAPLIAREADTAATTYLQRYRVNYAQVLPSHPAISRLLDLMVAKHTIVEPTLFVFFSRDSASPPARWSALITRELHRRGIPIIAGTDGLIGVEGDTIPTGAIPNLHQELQLLVEQGGLSPHEAILAATSTAARAIGIDSLVGTLAPGKLADLVVLTADPLSNIKNTQAIEMVIKRGRIVGR